MVYSQSSQQRMRCELMPSDANQGTRAAPVRNCLGIDQTRPHVTGTSENSDGPTFSKWAIRHAEATADPSVVLSLYTLFFRILRCSRCGCSLFFGLSRLLRTVSAVLLDQPRERPHDALFQPLPHRVRHTPMA
jgi:hypothetical protein